MIKWFTASLMCLVFASTLQAQAPVIKSFNKIPTSIEEFVAMRDRESTTPEGGAMMVVVALLMYSQDAKLGMQAYTVALDQMNLVEGGSNAVYMGFSPTQGERYNLENYYGKHKDHLGNSYILGTSVNNNYRLPAAPYKMEFTRNKYSEQTNGDIKVFIKCSGADSARPVTLRKNNRGIWKVTTCNSLFVGVRKQAVDDRL